MKLYGVMYIDQHCSKKLLVVWRNHTITMTSVELSSNGSFQKYINGISFNVLNMSFKKMPLMSATKGETICSGLNMLYDCISLESPKGKLNPSQT